MTKRQELKDFVKDPKRAEKVVAGVNKSSSGVVSIEGDGITYMQLLMLRTGLEMHIRTNGRMKLTRGPKSTTLARRMLGIKGNPQKLLDQVNVIINSIDRERDGEMQ